VPAAAPHYESFYLKACAPDGGLGLWLRYTVLKPPGAERWVWLHGRFGDPDGDAWLDVAAARVRLGRLLLPWLASGALCLDGVRHPLGGPGRWRATHIAETSGGCDFELAGRALRVRGTVRAARKDVAGWSTPARPAAASGATVHGSTTGANRRAPVADPIAIVDDGHAPTGPPLLRAKAAFIERLLGHPRAEGDDV